MALLREVRGFADDVVAPFVDGGDEGNFIGLRDTQHNPVADGNGVGGANAFEAEIAFDAALHELTSVGAHNIAAAGVAHHGAMGCSGGERFAVRGFASQKR